MWYVRHVKCDTRKYCSRNGEVSHQREENNTELETMQRKGNVHEQGTTKDNCGSIPQGTSGRQAERIKVVPPKEAGKLGCLSFNSHLPLAEGCSPRAEAGSALWARRAHCCYTREKELVSLEQGKSLWVHWSPPRWCISKWFPQGRKRRPSK